MGAQDFTQTATGKTAKEAFSAAVNDAAYEEGHGGYTGSCAEKHEFRMIIRKPGMTIGEQIAELSRWDGTDDPMPFPYEDKWGPAGCLAHDDGETFTFFGNASS